MQCIQQTRLSKCIDKFKRYLYYPNDYAAVKILLATVAANYMQRTSGNPVWLMLVGASSVGKSELFRSLEWDPHMLRAGSLSEAGLLAAGPVGKGETGPVGLLPRIGPFGFLVFSEFSCILGQNKHRQEPLLAALRQIYDGQWERSIYIESGQLQWSGHCGMLAASAPGIDAQRGVIARMGERFLYHRIVLGRKDESEYTRLCQFNRTRHKEMRESLNEATQSVLLPLTVIPTPTSTPYPDETSEYVHALAHIVAKCRSVVDRNDWNNEITFVHEQERIGRVESELHGLLCGLLSIGVEFSEAWDLIRRVAWDSIPTIRARLLRLLLSNTDLGSDNYLSGAYRLVRMYQDASTDGHGIDVKTLKNNLEDLTKHGVLEQRPGGRTGVLDGWRVPMSTWDAYAATLVDPPSSITTNSVSY